MKQELTLEEFFKLASQDAQERVEDIADMLNCWEPSIRNTIEAILLLGIFKPEHAIMLLSKLQSSETFHAIRRHMTGTNENRDMFLSMLIVAYAQNYSFNYEHRFDTLEYYVGNPRFNITVPIWLAFGEAFAMLANETKIHAENMVNMLDRMSYYSGAEAYNNLRSALKSL